METITESNLQENQIIKELDTFMMCLYWVSHDHKLPVFQPWRTKNSGTQEEVFRFTNEEVSMSFVNPF